MFRLKHECHLTEDSQLLVFRLWVIGEVLWWDQAGVCVHKGVWEDKLIILGLFVLVVGLWLVIVGLFLLLGSRETL